MYPYQGAGNPGGTTLTRQVASPVARPHPSSPPYEANLWIHGEVQAPLPHATPEARGIALLVSPLPLGLRFRRRR